MGQLTKGGERAPQEITNGYARSEFHFPLLENRWDQPSWQFVSAVTNRGVIDAGAQKLIGKSDRAGNPIGDSAIACEALVPIEIRRPSFHGSPDVAKPERAAGSVPQHVDAQDPQVVFRAQQAHVDAVQIYQAGTLEQLVRR